MIKKSFYAGMLIIMTCGFVLTGCHSTGSIMFTNQQPVGQYKQVEIVPTVLSFGSSKAIAPSEASVLARFYQQFPSDKYVIVAIETVNSGAGSYSSATYIITYVERQ